MRFGFLVGAGRAPLASTAEATSGAGAQPGPGAQGAPDASGSTSGRHPADAPADRGARAADGPATGAEAGKTGTASTTTSGSHPSATTQPRLSTLQRVLLFARTPSRRPEPAPTKAPAASASPQPSSLTRDASKPGGSPASPTKKDLHPPSTQAGWLRQKLHGVRSRLGPVKLDATLGPVSLTRVRHVPRATETGTTPTRHMPVPKGASDARSIDAHAARADRRAGGLLASAASRGHPALTTTGQASANGGSAIASSAASSASYTPKPDDFDPTQHAFSQAVTELFTRRVPVPGGAPGELRTLGRLQAMHLSRSLLQHPQPAALSRPDDHPLRHEQALLIATALSTVTTDALEARAVYNHLWHAPRPTLPGVQLRPAGTPSPLAISVHDDRPSTDPDIQRKAHAAQRVLAATAGGMQALQALQGLSMPPADHPDHAQAAHALEHYKLGLRAETALLRLGLPVGGTQSTEDIFQAVEAAAKHDHRLDPAYLGTGNAKRRPGGRHEPEHPATLASQAFLYARFNRRQRLDQPAAVPAFKPAYVALRNGFTESGQGSDFHLMVKRLRKFLPYIDLACRTPVGTAPSAWSAVKHPHRALRRVIGKDKTPLRTLMEAGPLGAALSHTAQGNAALQAALDKRFAQQQAAFDGATPAQRREILRQVMLEVVGGGSQNEYVDGRKHGVSAALGHGAATVPGLGGLNIGLTPMLELSGNHSRTAVFRAGVTGQLFLGTERKTTGTVGAGLRAGVQVGPMLNLSGQAMARLGGTHLKERGLMIRVPPGPSAASTAFAANVAAQAAGEGKPALAKAAIAQADAPKPAPGEALVHTIFDIAQLPPALRPAHGGAMWARVVEALGDHPNLSFGWNQGGGSTVAVSLSVDASAGVTLAPGVGASATAGVGLTHVLRQQAAAADAAGQRRVVQASSGNRTAITLGASAGLTHPSLQHPGQPDLTMFSQHRVGVETELLLQSQSGSVRIATEEGRVVPAASFRHREVGLPRDFIPLVNGHRDAWAQRLGQRTEDGTLKGGEQALDDFLQQVADLPTGGARTFTERQCLTRAAAARIDAHLERLATLQQRVGPAAGDDGLAARVTEQQRAIAALVEDAASWEPARLFVSETARVTRETGLGGDIRATPHRTGDGSNLAERFLGGGKVSLGGHVSTAAAGRDLLVLEAQPLQA